ncbi:MAG: hypothetical protein OEM92_03290 [Gammaproteobacteria bacterium]|nr:hypothetical protein [Gammaproteobacteria bacterium]
MTGSPDSVTWEDVVDWDVVDFTIFGAMLAGAAVIYTLAKRAASSAAYRLAVCVALAAAFILIWVNGAVGIIGNESNDANLIFFGVLAVGIIGAIIARFQPRGMARALFATAIAQVAVAVVALIFGLGSTAPIWPEDILMLTGFFVALWLLAAWLFRNAARQQTCTSSKPEA